MIYIIMGLVYPFVMGATFRIMAKRMDIESDPWVHPGPSFSALFWPLTLPAALGATVASARGTRNSRDDRRRARELEEAKHRKEVARINAEALAISEKSVLD